MRGSPTSATREGTASLPVVPATSALLPSFPGSVPAGKPVKVVAVFLGVLIAARSDPRPTSPVSFSSAARAAAALSWVSRVALRFGRTAPSAVQARQKTINAVKNRTRIALILCNHIASEPHHVRARAHSQQRQASRPPNPGNPSASGWAGEASEAPWPRSAGCVPGSR